MKRIIDFIAICIVFIGLSSYAQTARVKGILLDESNKPIAKASVKANTTSVISNENGFFQITVPANQKITIEITHVSYKKVATVLFVKTQ